MRKTTPVTAAAITAVVNIAPVPASNLLPTGVKKMKTWVKVCHETAKISGSDIHLLCNIALVFTVNDSRTAKALIAAIGRKRNRPYRIGR